MIRKLERFFYYPVLVFGTAGTLGFWSASEFVLALAATIAIAILWARPLLPVKFEPLARVCIWLFVCPAALYLAYMSFWFGYSKIPGV